MPFFEDNFLKALQSLRFGLLTEGIRVKLGYFKTHARLRSLRVKLCLVKNISFIIKFYCHVNHISLRACPRGGLKWLPSLANFKNMEINSAVRIGA